MLTQGGHRSRRCDLGDGLQHRASHLRVDDLVVSMPALGSDPDQPAFGQPAQVRGGGGGMHPGPPRPAPPPAAPIRRPRPRASLPALGLRSSRRLTARSRSAGVYEADVSLTPPALHSHDLPAVHSFPAPTPTGLIRDDAYQAMTLAVVAVVIAVERCRGDDGSKRPRHHREASAESAACPGTIASITPPRCTRRRRPGP